MTPRPNRMFLHFPRPLQHVTYRDGRNSAQLKHGLLGLIGERRGAIIDDVMPAYHTCAGSSDNEGIGFIVG